MLQLFTIRECAERTKMSESTIRRAVKAGTLHAFHSGSNARIHPEDFRNCLEKLRNADTPDSA